MDWTGSHVRARQPVIRLGDIGMLRAETDRTDIPNAGSDEAAFDLFFELLDRFRKETRETKKD